MRSTDRLGGAGYTLGARGSLCLETADEVIPIAQCGVHGVQQTINHFGTSTTMRPSRTGLAFAFSVPIVRRDARAVCSRRRPCTHPSSNLGDIPRAAKHKNNPNMLTRNTESAKEFFVSGDVTSGTLLETGVTGGGPEIFLILVHLAQLSGRSDHHPSQELAKNNEGRVLRT